MNWLRWFENRVLAPSRYLILLFLGVILAGMFCFGDVGARAAIIDQDTTIDAASPFSGDSIRVIDGPNGAAHVNITNGGVVVGFDGRDNSEITLNGGSVTYPSSLHDHARFIMNSGEVTCSAPGCASSDFFQFLEANDFSALHLYGGRFHADIRLNGSSVAHFYGQNLRLLSAGGAHVVVGNYANGDPILVPFQTPPDIASRIIFHNVPEPSTATGLLVLCFLAFAVRLTRT